MKLWRGQPEHSHWRALLTARDRSLAFLAIGSVFISLAAVKFFDATATCTSRRLLCAIPHLVASGLGITLAAAEVALWGSAGLVLLALGVAYWRSGSQETPSKWLIWS